jgi:hypothetical protein
LVRSAAVALKVVTSVAVKSPLLATPAEWSKRVVPPLD